jgi:hypothetical protein
MARRAARHELDRVGDFFQRLHRDEADVSATREAPPPSARQYSASTASKCSFTTY